MTFFAVLAAYSCIIVTIAALSNLGAAGAEIPRSSKRKHCLDQHGVCNSIGACVIFWSLTTPNVKIM